MIKAIYVLGIGAAGLVNIAALTLLVLRYIPFPATARATGIIGVCLVFFSLEHFVGLGSLYPLFLPLTAMSLFVIWTERAWFSNETFRTSEIVFLCALLYGALWRLSSHGARSFFQLSRSVWPGSSSRLSACACGRSCCRSRRSLLEEPGSRLSSISSPHRLPPTFSATNRPSRP